jgi:2-C-methyl-D-erythritol 4-phosphate cytidylyltransferase
VTVAVLLAGGIGSRIGGEVPKQLIPLGGRPMLEHSLATFSAHPGIDEILVVMEPRHLDAAQALVSGFPLVTQVIPGGATRSDSTLRALDALPDPDAFVLFHDAARPLVTARIISECLSALETHDAVGTVVPSADTVWAVDGDGRLAGIPSRAGLRRAQTPQGFRVSTLRAAYARAAVDPDFEATDDCAVVFRYTPDVPIALVAGDEANLKVTEPLDLVIAEHLLAQRREQM